MALIFIEAIEEIKEKMHEIIQIHNHAMQFIKIKGHPNWQNVGKF